MLLLKNIMKNLRLVFLVLLLGILTSAAATAAQFSIPTKRCEKISSHLCTKIRYNVTVMPNFMGHNSQQEATEGLIDYEPFLNHTCSPYIRLFICSTFFPLCSEHVVGPILACKGLCEKVKNDCLTELLSMGLTWPQELNCARFPEPTELCMQPSEDNEFVSGLYIPDDVYNLNHCPPPSKLVDGKCVQLCQNKHQYQKTVATFEIWVAVWSIICLVFTAFSLLTFLIQPKRFRWPARPILYLTSCGFITSTIYLIRWIEGPYTCTGESQLEKPSESLSCVGISLILLFCDIAYTLWWSVFCFVWFLSAMKEWSTEAIEKISTRLHAVVWIFSAIPMLYILDANNININYLSGFCEVKNVPLILFQLVFLVLSNILSILTSIALKNVRSTLISAGRSPMKLERLFYRLVIISVGICVPHFLYLICQFYDTFTMALLKLVLRKMSIIFATLWVFSPKTFQVWDDVLCSPCRSKVNDDIVVNDKWTVFNLVFPNMFKTGENLPKIGKTNLPLVPVTKV